MKRQVQGLVWAAAVPRPKSIPVGRARGRKAFGVRYERELAKALPEADHGSWWEFQDRAGRGFCQTDLVLPLVLQRMQLVMEAKYTWTPEAQWELDKLYCPVVERAKGQPALGLVVCRGLTPEVPKGAVCADLPSAVERLLRGEAAVLHWFSGPLRTQTPIARPGALAPIGAFK